MSVQVPWRVSRGQKATLGLQLSASIVDPGPRACTPIALLPALSEWPSALS